MKIRIHQTDFEGHPVECTGDWLAGETELDIVNAMKMNPFNDRYEPVEFMRIVLDRIGQKDLPLNPDPEKAAVEFLQKLKELGYATCDDSDSENSK